jgi:sulfur-carrier protein
MNVQVQVFASLKSCFGSSYFQLDVKDASNIEDLRQKLIQGNPGAAPVLAASRFAINESFVTPDHKLSENDYICILPPSSGG